MIDEENATITVNSLLPAGWKWSGIIDSYTKFETNELDCELLSVQRN